MVARRRMVRAYQPEPVDPDTLARILDVARRAPSAGFSQGQRFVVVTDPALRRTIAQLAGEDAYARRGFDRWLSSAPVHVVVCADEDAYRQRYAEQDKEGVGGLTVPYVHVDAGAALMLLLLAVVDEGLAAGLLGAHRVVGIRQALDIPATVHVVGVVTVGHPAPDRRSSSLRRGWRDLDEVVSWQRWGRRRDS